MAKSKKSRKSKISECPTHEKYEAALNLLFYEGQMLWQIMTAFMLIHTVILGFISQIIYKGESINIFNNLPCFVGGVLGLILIFPWWGTFERNSDYYHFRMAQAKEAEPNDWKLLMDDGENFAKGNQVDIRGEKFQIGYRGRLMRNKKAVYIALWAFTSIYLLIIIFSCPCSIFCK